MTASQFPKRNVRGKASGDTAIVERAIYIGTDPSYGYYYDIPARDLSPEEFAALNEAQKALVRGSYLYKIIAEEVPINNEEKG